MAAPTTVGPDSGPVQQDTDSAGLRRCRDRGRCRMRVVGYLHGRGGRRARSDRSLWAGLPGLDCDSPLLAECRDCGRPEKWSCSNHRQSRCRPCAARYRRRLGRIAESGCQRREGFLYLLTLTAPGEHQHVNSGTGTVCPCTPPGGVDLARWNTDHSRRWNHFRTRLKQDVPEAQFLRGVEVQKRGALHDHALLWSPVPLDIRSLRVLAIAAGFGHSLDLAPVVPGSRKAAYYVSKYVVKSCDSREEVPWLGEYADRRTGEIRFGLVTARFRTWSSSRDWGLTMAAVRSICAQHARQRADAEHQETLQLLMSALGAELVSGADPPV